MEPDGQPTPAIRMRILHDFPALQNRDLELKQFEQVNLISRLDQDWCYGETDDGRQGYFPFVYAELVEAPAPDVEETTGAEGDQPKRVVSLPPVPPAKPAKHVKNASHSGDEFTSDKLDGRPTGDKELTDRNRIVDEIVTTEHSYLKYMQAICQVCKEKLSGELSDAEMKTCFSNVEQLMQFTNVFLPELRKAAKNEHEMIGKVYKQFSPFFKMYAAYCGGHRKASEKIEELSNKKRVQKLLDECQAEPACNGQNLQSLLIMPIQRVPRHKLLLKELLKHTDEKHPDYEPCKEALESISVVASHVNEHIRVYQSILKVWEIQRSMIPRPEIFNQGCKFIRQGTFHKRAHNGHLEELIFFLFSDSLVYGKPLPIVVNKFGTIRYQYRRTVKVADVVDDEAELEREISKARAIKKSPSGRSKSSVYRRISNGVGAVSGSNRNSQSTSTTITVSDMEAKPSISNNAAADDNPPSTADDDDELEDIEEEKTDDEEPDDEDVAAADAATPANPDAVTPANPDSASPTTAKPDSLVINTTPGKQSVDENSHTLFPFKVVGTKSFILYADSAAERDTWVALLREHCDPSVESDMAHKEKKKKEKWNAEKAEIDSKAALINVSAPVPLKTVTAWYKLKSRKKSTASSSNNNETASAGGPEIQISFHVSKTGGDLAKSGPVNSLSLLYLTMTVISAKGLRVADQKRHTSDPYCVLTCGKTSHRTKTCQKTLEPVWYEQFRDMEFIAGLFSTIDLEIFHEQSWGRSSSLGFVSIQTDTLCSLVGIAVEAQDQSALAISETAKKCSHKSKKTVENAQGVEFRVAEKAHQNLKAIAPENTTLPSAEEQKQASSPRPQSHKSKPLPKPPGIKTSNKLKVDTSIADDADDAPSMSTSSMSPRKSKKWSPVANKAELKKRLFHLLSHSGADKAHD